jgi:hypothetical protein
MANLFQENMQLRMRIWINCDLEKRNEDIIKNILKWCNNPHFLVDIVQSRKLKIHNILENMKLNTDSNFSTDMGISL